MRSSTLPSSGFCRRAAENYSSGMVARLGFAIATVIERISSSVMRSHVGDFQFQQSARNASTDARMGDDFVCFHHRAGSASATAPCGWIMAT
ncbi:MAG: hypothetical protein ACLUVV_04545 [Christensenellales bacterium]